MINIYPACNSVSRHFQYYKFIHYFRYLHIYLWFEYQTA